MCVAGADFFQGGGGSGSSKRQVRRNFQIDKHAKKIL